MNTTTISTSAEAQSPRTADEDYNYALGYLRALVVALVVAHHSLLAYYAYAPGPNASLAVVPRWWQAFPVVDPQRWGLAALLVGFNDIFFMALMFFLSGLFVWRGLARKGGVRFLRDRLLRLGIPFAVAALLLAPIAYYPAYLQTTEHPGFWREWWSLGQWPAGPAWFLWVLFVFDCAAALLFFAAPRWAEAAGRRLEPAGKSPALFYVALVAVTGAAYVPMAIHFSPLRWSAWGPFTFQTSRILLYLTYFLIGAALGARGTTRGLLEPKGKLARCWLLWVLTAPVFFGVAVALTIAAATMKSLPPALYVAVNAAFVFSCAASGLACLALALRFAQRRSRELDSLNANSYAIYLLHYMFVSWLQLALTHATMPPALKFAMVFTAALALSWTTAAILRRIPAVRRLV